MHTLYDPLTAADNAFWEALWEPYDQPTYQAVLELLTPDDIVLEIGAGDLRLAILMAKATQKVYAIEIQQLLLDRALNSSSGPLPGNLNLTHGDACTLPFPSGIMTGVLLMRHCTHFHLYANKLKRAGCKRLITNARWGMGVEEILLQEPRALFDKFPMGWYACWCGAVGFKPGPAEQFTPEKDAIVHEVAGCPQCYPIAD
jgi:SAM-dependent methyltransferase